MHTVMMTITSLLDGFHTSKLKTLRRRVEQGKKGIGKRLPKKHLVPRMAPARRNSHPHRQLEPQQPQDSQPRPRATIMVPQPQIAINMTHLNPRELPTTTTNPLIARHPTHLQTIKAQFLVQFPDTVLTIQHTSMQSHLRTVNLSVNPLLCHRNLLYYQSSVKPRCEN